MRGKKPLINLSLRQTKHVHARHEKRKIIRTTTTTLRTDGQNTQKEESRRVHRRTTEDYQKVYKVVRLYGIYENDGVDRR